MTTTSTRELAQDAWSEYLDAVTTELLHAPVSIEIIASPRPSAVEPSRLALETVTYDERRDVFEIAAACGGSDRPSVLRHTVDHPRRIEVDSQYLLAPMTITVEGVDGARTVIKIERD